MAPTPAATAALPAGATRRSTSSRCSSRRPPRTSSCSSRADRRRGARKICRRDRSSTHDRPSRGVRRPDRRAHRVQASQNHDGGACRARRVCVAVRAIGRRFPRVHRRSRHRRRARTAFCRRSRPATSAGPAGPRSRSSRRPAASSPCATPTASPSSRSSTPPPCPPCGPPRRCQDRRRHVSRDVYDAGASERAYLLARLRIALPTLDDPRWQAEHAPGRRWIPRSNVGVVTFHSVNNTPTVRHRLYTFDLSDPLAPGRPYVIVDASLVATNDTEMPFIPVGGVP